MNTPTDNLNRLHDLAHHHARFLRRQAFARFWTNVHTWLTALVTGNGAKPPVNQHPGA
jgi:hypothetical protein